MTKRRIRLLAFAGIVLTALNMRAAVTGLPPLIGRMARFEITPRALTTAEINRIIPWFTNPS